MAEVQISHAHVRFGTWPFSQHILLESGVQDAEPVAGAIPLAKPSRLAHPDE